MKLLFVADGRSPIALNWIRYFVEAGHEVHWVSTYPCKLDLKLASLMVIPTALGSMAGELEAKGMKDQGGVGAGRRKILRRFIPVEVRNALRHWLGPLTLPGAARQLRGVLARIRPDLVHAMRIPYEGMLTALADPPCPLIVSTWGNDFTLHARSTLGMIHYTRLTLRRANALHTDCYRDQRLAREWGFAEDKPRVVLPGGGGIQLDLFYPASPHDQARGATVINPRGFRPYIRNDTFFRAIPLVLQRLPNIRFVCPTMQGEAQAERWVAELGIASAVDLLPRQTRPQMAERFRQAQVVVSLSTHDGTPNTLLEAMACGCFPVAGDIESLREWITPGVNGLLTAPDDPHALAEAILQALEQPALRQHAAAHNLRLITERAEYGRVMQQAEEFYRKLV